MGQLSGEHYSDAEELEVFSNWFHELWQQDRVFAEALVQGVIDAEFSQPTVDKTGEI